MKIIFDEQQDIVLSEIRSLYSDYKTNLLAIKRSVFKNIDIKRLYSIFLKLRDEDKIIDMFYFMEWTQVFYFDSCVKEEDFESNIEDRIYTMYGRDISDLEKRIYKDCNYNFSQDDLSVLKKQGVIVDSNDGIEFGRNDNDFVIIRISKSFIDVVIKYKKPKQIKKIKVIDNPDIVFEDNLECKYEEFSYYQSGTIKFDGKAIGMVNYIKTLFVIFIKRGGQDVPIDIIQEAFNEEEMASDKGTIQKYISRLRGFIKEQTEEYEIIHSRGTGTYTFQKK